MEMCVCLRVRSCEQVDKDHHLCMEMCVLMSMNLCAS